jgi:hypothetical protein
VVLSLWAADRSCRVVGVFVGCWAARWRPVLVVWELACGGVCGPVFELWVVVAAVAVDMTIL